MLIIPCAVLPKRPCCREQKTKQGRGQAEQRIKAEQSRGQRADTHSGGTAEGALALKIEHEVPTSSKHRPH